MVTSIAVWFLIVQANPDNLTENVAPVQLGPYSDVESCQRVSDIRDRKGAHLIGAERSCVQVNVPVLTLPLSKG